MLQASRFKGSGLESAWIYSNARLFNPEALGLSDYFEIMDFAVFINDLRQPALNGCLESGFIDIGAGKFFSGIGLQPPLFATHRFVKIVEHKAQQGVSGEF